MPGLAARLGGVDRPKPLSESVCRPYYLDHYLHLRTHAPRSKDRSLKVRRNGHLRVTIIIKDNDDRINLFPFVTQAITNQNRDLSTYY